MTKTHYPYSQFKDDVKTLGTRLMPRLDSVYGIPRGGIPLAMALSNETGLRLLTEEHEVGAQTLVVDDIIDSGATRERWIDNPFMSLHCRPGKTYPITASLHETLDWIVYWWEANEADSITDSVTRQLQFIGEDISREGLRDTPLRVVRSWDALYGGYDLAPEKLMRTFVEGACDEMVLLKDIELFSTCEHHMLPFYGKAHIAYIPDGKVIGVSKLARLLDMYARRMQIQERIGQQVTDALMTYLQPKGAACIIEAQHMCMKARGVQKQNSVMVTSSLVGAFRDSAATRAELMGLIK